MQLLVRNKPTTLVCTGNIDYEMDWDSDEPLFLINNSDKIDVDLSKQGYVRNRLVPEVIVWAKSLDFGTTYIALQNDFDEIEMV